MPGELDKELGEAVDTWVDEGIITEEQARAILARHGAPERRGEPRTDWTSTLLYGTAGILVGAAAIALVLLGIDPADEAPWLLATAALLFGVGLGLEQVAATSRLLGEALLAAALVPLATAVPLADGGAIAVALAVGLAVPAGLLVWKRDQAFLAPFSVIAFTVAAGAGAFNLFSELDLTSDDATLLWTTLQLALLAGVVLIDRLMREEDGAVHPALATGAIAIALIALLAEGLDIQDSVNVELALGAIMLAILGIGILLQHRGVVVGAATAVGIDAIVFAFDVGGVWLGVGSLVGLAGLLVWQAEVLKGWIARAT